MSGLGCKMTSARWKHPAHRRMNKRKDWRLVALANILLVKSSSAGPAAPLSLDMEPSRVRTTGSNGKWTAAVMELASGSVSLCCTLFVVKVLGTEGSKLDLQVGTFSHWVTKKFQKAGLHDIYQTDTQTDTDTNFYVIPMNPISFNKSGI